MKIAISTDSACDMPKEFYDKYGVYILPYCLTLGDKEYQDNEISSSQIFDYVKETGNLPKTSARNEFSYREYFENLLKENDYVIHFSLSGDMTSSTANAINATNGINATVIDSKNLSSGIALLVLRACKLREENKTPEEIIEDISNHVSKVQTSFLIDTLTYLHKGGRCSSLALLGAKLLMIKPKISVVDGKMGVTKKYMGGINGCLKKYVDDVLSSSNPDKSIAFCTHTGQMVISSQICETLKNYGFEEVYDCEASSTISSHCGPNTLGILFFNKD